MCRCGTWVGVLRYKELPLSPLLSLTWGCLRKQLPPRAPVSFLLGVRGAWVNLTLKESSDGMSLGLLVLPVSPSASQFCSAPCTLGSKKNEPVFLGVWCDSRLPIYTTEPDF